MRVYSQEADLQSVSLIAMVGPSASGFPSPSRNFNRHVAPKGNVFGISLSRFKPQLRPSQLCNLGQVVQSL